MHDTEAPTMSQAEQDAAAWRSTAGRYLSALEVAERQRDEVGIQLVAAQERIKLLEEGVDLLRDISDGTCAVPAGFEHHYLVEKATIDIGVGCFLARLDTVPGDALVRP